MLPAMSKDRDDDKSRSDDAEEERSDENPGGSDKASAGSRSSGSRRPREADEDDEDDDEDDEDDDEDEDEDEGEDYEEEEEARPAPRRARRPVKSRPKRPPAPPKQLTEKEINSPEPQTLVMLGVVALMTLIMWGTARFACNAHPAQTVKPREVSTRELARDPKDAAVELEQRWATKRYGAALELATGGLVTELTKDKKACDANKKACAAESKKLSAEVLTTGEMLSREPAGAVVRVTSSGGPGGKQSYLIHLGFDGTIWKADSRKPATGAAMAVPSGSAPAMPVPGASAAPAGSAH